MNDTQRYSRLLLIFPPFTKPALLDYAPIGICQLAAYVRQELPATAIRVLDFTNHHYSDEEYKRELQQIYMLYAVSIALQLGMAMVRHGQAKRTVQKLWLHGRDLLRHRRVGA